MPPAGTCSPACAGVVPWGSTELPTHIRDNTAQKWQVLRRLCPARPSAGTTCAAGSPADSAFHRHSQRAPERRGSWEQSPEPPAGIAGGQSRERSCSYRCVPGKAAPQLPETWTLWVTSAFPPPRSRTASTHRDPGDNNTSLVPSPVVPSPGVTPTRSVTPLQGPYPGQLVFALPRGASSAGIPQHLPVHLCLHILLVRVLLHQLGELSVDGLGRRARRCGYQLSAPRCPLGWGQGPQQVPSPQGSARVLGNSPEAAGG